MQFGCYVSADDLAIMDKIIKEIQFLKSPDKITQAEMIKQGLTMLLNDIKEKESKSGSK